MLTDHRQSWHYINSDSASQHPLTYQRRVAVVINAQSIYFLLQYNVVFVVSIVTDSVKHISVFL